MRLSPHPKARPVLGRANAVDPSALTEALASGELMTANQAAQLVGIPFTTFNYHVRLGHVAVIPNPASKMNLVTRASAERFARRLAQWRSQTTDFDWLSDEDMATQDETEDAPDTQDPIAASA